MILNKKEKIYHIYVQHEMLDLITIMINPSKSIFGEDVNALMVMIWNFTEGKNYVPK